MNLAMVSALTALPSGAVQGPATAMNSTLEPYWAYKLSSLGAIFWQCAHHGSMNSTRTTLPRNEEREIDWPVKPLGPTTGRVKSGAPPDWDVAAVELVVEGPDGA